MGYNAPLTSTSNWGIMRCGAGLSVTNGIVSVNPSPGGIFDVGYFYSDVTQTNPTVGSVNIVVCNDTTLSQGITLVAGSQFTVSKAGNYTITYTIQFEKTAGGEAANIDVWLRRNAVDVADSNTNFTITNNAAQSIAATYTLTLNSGDFLQFAWQSTSSNAILLALPAQIDPIRPTSPSVRVTLLQV